MQERTGGNLNYSSSSSEVWATCTPHGEFLLHAEKDCMGSFNHKQGLKIVISIESLPSFRLLLHKSCWSRGKKYFPSGFVQKDNFWCPVIVCRDGAQHLCSLQGFLHAVPQQKWAAPHWPCCWGLFWTAKAWRFGGIMGMAVAKSMPAGESLPPLPAMPILLDAH